MKYICKRCGHIDTHKGNFIKHLKRINPCKVNYLDIPNETLIQELTENITKKSKLNPKMNPIESNLNPKMNSIELNLIKTYIKDNSTTINKHKCIYCNKIYSTNSNMCKHLKKCKEKKEKFDQKNVEMIEIYKEEMKLLKKQIEILIMKTGNTNIENISNCNNIINNNNTVNIQINGWGQEDTSHLSDKFLRFCYDRPFTSIQRVIEAVYFNPNYPKNWNVMIKDDKSSKALIYDQEKDAWLKKETIGVVDDLMHTGYSILDGNFDKQKDTNKLTDRIIEKFTKFQEFYAKSDKEYEKRLKTEIKELLINHKAYHITKKVK